MNIEVEFQANFEHLLSVGLSDKYIPHQSIASLKLEDFLNWLTKGKGYLFHGSGTLIPRGKKLISMNRGVLHATDEGSVAILKALFPNNLPGQTNLNYRIDKSGRQEVIIEGNPKGKVVREKGYIYVLEKAGFSNEGTQGIADYIKPLAEGEGQNYLFLVEVEKSDFNYSYRIAGNNS